MHPLRGMDQNILLPFSSCFWEKLHTLHLVCLWILKFCSYFMDVYLKLDFDEEQGFKIKARVSEILEFEPVHEWVQLSSLV
ncbi:hypothetical protein RIF29_39103 [Crotalaria pallida]|uniref:Uncharacterized protein n=1 Tax=Crotalaria pallida TaxID=3830 RepID=A0AAN9E3L1_CROPI